MEPRAFYLPLGDDRFESTLATAGPWSADAQHGGPPSALLVRAPLTWSSWRRQLPPRKPRPIPRAPPRPGLIRA